MGGISFDDALDDLVWRCACDYVNVGSERCAQCGRRGAHEVGADDRAAPFTPVRPAVTGTSSGRAFLGAAALVTAVIVLNVVLQGAIGSTARRNGLDLSRGLLLALGTGLLFYGIVGVAAVLAITNLHVRASIVVGSPASAVARGLATGGGIGLVLALIGRAAGIADPLSALLASDGHLGVLLVGVLAVVLVGPAVEELVFRGLLAETMRGRGRGVAVWASAAAFSLAHLRLSQFRYFVWMGAVFGALWWRRGLLSSVTAHAAFNGALLAVAVLGAHGPAVTLRTEVGATWRLPAAWHQVTVPNEDLGAVGPHGATIEVAHVDGGNVASLDTLATGLRSGIAPSPGVVVDTASVRSTTVAGRPALAVRTVAGRAASMVFVADGRRRWIVVAQHLDDATFAELLAGLTLPAPSPG